MMFVQDKVKQIIETKFFLPNQIYIDFYQFLLKKDNNNNKEKCRERELCSWFD